METLESLPLLSPVGPKKSSKGKELPLWRPAVERPRPPPLPCLSKGLPSRTITSKQYKELSQLSAARQRALESNGEAHAAPVVETVGRIVGASLSESEGAVTSPAGAKRKPLPSQHRRSPPPPVPLTITSLSEDEEAELESILEETFPIVDNAQRKGPLGKEFGEAKRVESEAGGARQSAAFDDRDEEQEKEAEGEGAQEEQQYTTEQQEEDLSGLDAGAAGKRAVLAALTSLGYASWEALAAEIKSSAAVAAASRPSAGRQRRGGGKPDGEVRLADVLNPNSAMHNAAFEKAYQKARQDLQRHDKAKRKQAKLEGHSALVHRWSALTAAEHSWYLQREGHKLTGSDAERFATLKAKVEAEQRDYWGAVYGAAGQYRKRYDHATERQTAQLQADMRLRRQRGLALPQYYTLNSTIRLPAAHAGGAEEGIEELKWVKRLQEGEAMKIRPLPPATSLPGNKLYLPAVLSSSAGEGGPSGGISGVFRKRAVPEVWSDESLRKFAHEKACISESGNGMAMTVAAAAGAVSCLLSSGMRHHRQSWEIPVKVVEEHDAASDSNNKTKMKTVLLGKPLLARREKMRDKQRRLQKYAVLSAALEAQGGEGESLRTPSYDLWSLGDNLGVQLIIKSHGRVIVGKNSDNDKEPAGPAAEQTTTTTTTSAPEGDLCAVFAIKTDYLPHPDEEEDTIENLVSWWCKLALNHGAAAAAVAAVDVPHARTARWRTLQSRDIQELWGEIDPRDGTRALHAVLRGLQGLDPGSYVLAHASGDSEVCVYKSTEQAPPSEQEVQPLPISCTDSSDLEIVYDLHAACEHAGEVDAATDPFVPPRWRPFSAEVAQVPYTFPPAVGGKERGGARSRQRRLPWGGDMDQVQHVATISRADYEAGLAEEL